MRPEKTMQVSVGDIPLLHVVDFTMYELDTKHLKTLMLGKQGYRYKDRFTIDEIDHTDNSAKYLANLRADFGIYKNDILNLDGNVTFVRVDGLSYETQHATYNKKNALFRTDTDYRLHYGQNMVRGTYLDYNNINGKIHSKDVFATYKIQ